MEDEPSRGFFLPINFRQFCSNVIGLTLTEGQSIVAQVAFEGLDPKSLPASLVPLAKEMLGGCLDVPERSKRLVCLELGRGSGKTSLYAAWCLYCALTMEIKVGPGDVPICVCVAPDKPTASLAIRMCREMARKSPAIERLIVSDETNGQRPSLLIRRPDGQLVSIEAFAASRGGANVRGRTILTFVLDEAQFFNPFDDGAYVVNDKDVYRALIPRLVPLKRGGKGFFISTPWPTETFMAECMDKNYGHIKTELCMRATTPMMRGDDPEVLKAIEDELERDEENARREFFCEKTIAGEGFFFSHDAISSSIYDGEYPLEPEPGKAIAVGCDFAFKRDSSAICVVQFDGHYKTLFHKELKPKPGKPLKPSEVVEDFAKIAKMYGAQYVVADGHYREALKEHLEKHGLSIWDAPEGSGGKERSYSRARACMHEGLCRFPRGKIPTQLKTVIARPSPGGGISIKVPRRAGSGHGDLISAWVLAVYHLAYEKLEKKKAKPLEGAARIAAENEKMAQHYDKLEQKAIKEAEKAAKKQNRYKSMIELANRLWNG